MKQRPTIEDIEVDWALTLATEGLMDAVRAIHRAGRARHRWQRGDRVRAVREALETVRAQTVTVKANGAMYMRIPKSDSVRPSHYTCGRAYDPIDAIRAWGLDFHLGNALKYIARAGRKDNAIEDLEKCEFYLSDWLSASDRK